MAAVALIGPAGSPPPAPDAAVAGVPTGFTETVAFSGLTNPTVVRFANDGRVFVAEKRGLIKVFDNLSDTSPTVFADLTTNVYNLWDRGLLGMALAPNFPTSPYVYVLYAYDHELGSSSPPPRWGDACPTPPGTNTDGCVVSGRLSRLQAAGNVMTGSEQVLVEDWCQQYPSHSVGTVEFGPDGALYAGAGDGASFTFADYGQAGIPLNPCGDPPGGVGGVQTPPTAEGGALRAQDLRTSGDPATLDGSIIRVDPSTGAGMSDNPFAGSADANVRRIIGYGLRNPFRFTFRPSSSEIWIGDVGWGSYEEINRIMNPSDAVVENFGWPCYEGQSKQGQYDSANLSICETLYGQPSADTKPFFAYQHGIPVAGESCPTSGGSSISGLSFEFAPQGSTFPTNYQGALFFADYSRDCIWAMRKNGNPIPSPGSIDPFVAPAANPVNLEFGPNGDLYYVDFDGGTIRRIHYGPSNPPPPTPGTHFLSDLAWTSQINTNTPVVLDLSRDGNPLTLNGTTFAKGLGTHAISEVTYYLGGACSRFTASVGIDDEEGPEGSVVFQVYADATKIYDSGVMTGATATANVDVSVSGASQLRVAVTDGGDNINSDHGDWALAQIQCGGTDTTPPSVVATTPVNGSTTAPAASPTATFSEAMDASTLTTSTFTLIKQGTSTPLSASVSYNAVTRVATLDPSADLEVGASYTAKVKGGTGGAKDLAGNALAADVSWSFTTVAGANRPPTPIIDAPPSTSTWKVGDLISFSGHATDPEQGTLPASSLSWTLLQQHCPSTCHSHTVQTWPGVTGGSFNAPDHDYPSYLELQLTATDAGGLATTTSVRLDPLTVAVTFLSAPAGLQLAVGSASSVTPFTRTVIVGSTTSISATTPQLLGGTTYEFSSWSDGGAQTHNIVAPADPASYTATFVIPAPQNTGLPSISGRTRVGQTLTASNGSWNGSLPMTFTFQWLRCSTNSLNSCTAIAGATADTYVVKSADVSFRLRVEVTATNAAGSGSATSNSTGRIR